MNNEQQNFTLLKDSAEYKYNYKITNWKTFQKNLARKIDQDEHIPNNRNLTNTEIDHH